MCPLNTVMLQRGKLLKIKREPDDVPNDAATGEAAEDQEEPVPDDDDLRRVIVDARTQCESQKEKLKFDHMLEDHKKGFYPNCEDGNTKLYTILELLQWKAENGVPEKNLRSY